jgi:ubiquinone biosynthesis protein Coq4
MWISVVTTHMAFVDPYMIVPAMDAITQGWTYGRRARSIQFVRFEEMLDRPLADVRREYGLDEDGIDAITTPTIRTPGLLAA